MRTIAFDMMGNDNGVRAGVEAALDFVDKNLDYTFILVGNAFEINKFTKETERIQILDIKKEVDVKLGARAARSGNNSMSVAVNLVKDGKADAVISSGDSGIYLSITTLQLKRIENVKRPAFMPIFPTILNQKKFIMMDVGANLESTSEMLVQWAILGSTFSKVINEVQNPKIGIVNIGTEDKKGPNVSKEANEILKTTNGINYIGFIESRNLLNGVVDVAIVDGYAGNMILKTMEGSIISLLKLIKSKLSSKLRYKIGALIAKEAFNEVKEQLDYRNVGAAWVLGLNGLAIKAHGSSDKKAYLGAFKQISNALENNALDEFKKAMK